MATPTPTPISNVHVITLTGTGRPNPEATGLPADTAQMQNTARQIDVRKVLSWTYQLSADGSTFSVLLQLPGQLKSTTVPMLGSAGTGWNATKTASLAAGG